MTPRSLRFLAPLLLAAACTVESPLPELNCGSCKLSTDANFSFVTLLRPWGPDEDTAVWRFSVDELSCTLSHVWSQSDNTKLTVTCAVQGEPDDKSVPLFVNAATGYDGFGRVFRVDTMGRATSHVRIERDGVLLDEFDHSPTFTAPETCGSEVGAFKYDLGTERELPPPAQ